MLTNRSRLQKNRDNKYHRKAQQNLQHAKLMMPTPELLSPFLRAKLPRHQLLMYMLLLSVLLVPTPVAAAEIDIQRQEVLSAEISASPIQTTDSFKVSTATISSRLRFVSTPSSLEKVYKKSPKQFEKDKTRIGALFDKLSDETSLTACKLKSVAKDKTFHIKLGTNEDFPNQENTLGLFHAADNSITLRTNLDGSPKEIETVIHESHHAFLSQENKKANRHMLKGVALPLPHPDALKQVKEFKPMLEAGFTRIKSILSLLEKMEQNLKVTSDERKYILRLQAAAKKYKMPLDSGPLVNPRDEASLIKQGIIDKNGKALRNDYVLINDPVAPLYLQGIELRGDGKKIYRVSVLPKISTGFDQLKAILLSFYSVYAIGLPAHPYSHEFQRETESDAYTHQIFQSHPALFETLFPELLEYHRDRSDDEFRACLRAR